MQASTPPLAQSPSLRPMRSDEGVLDDDDDPLLSLLSAGDHVAALTQSSANGVQKIRKRIKNGAMRLPLSSALSFVPQSLVPIASMQALRRWSAMDILAEQSTPPATLSVTPLVLLCVVSTGACMSTEESVAGTGYRHEQLIALGGVELVLHFELSIRSSFQQRNIPKTGTASKGATNSNRLQIQEESDLLVQRAPGIAVVTVAPNASLTKKHYPYLRLVQRTGGPLLAQQACGSFGQFVVTHRLVWGVAGTNMDTLQVNRPIPVCKHGRHEEHDDCKFLDAYSMDEEIAVPDGQGGWNIIKQAKFSLRILGEKHNGNGVTAAAAEPSLTVKRKQNALIRAVAAGLAVDNQEDGSMSPKRRKIVQATQAIVVR